MGRMLQGPAKTFDKPSAKNCDESATGRIVTAKRPNHVWHVDLTVVPTGAGLWCSWLPLALPQRWPFCYWVGVAIDHFSRRAMGVATFKQQPTSLAVRSFLGRTMAKAKQKPRYIVCDRGPQFDCQDFRDWCQRKGIKKPRYGAVGKKGSIAVVERFILTLKNHSRLPASDPISTRQVPRRASCGCRVVQQVPSSLMARRPNSRRSLLSQVPGQSKAET